MTIPFRRVFGAGFSPQCGCVSVPRGFGEQAATASGNRRGVRAGSVELRGLEPAERFRAGSSGTAPFGRRSRLPHPIIIYCGAERKMKFSAAGKMFRHSKKTDPENVLSGSAAVARRRSICASMVGRPSAVFSSSSTTPACPSPESESGTRPGFAAPTRTVPANNRPAVFHARKA